MKISIITAVYNRASTIGRALNTVASQGHPDIEHIVIDGASTDGTLKEIARVRGPHLTLISEPDRGIYDALNKGISRCTGEIIGLMHSDDYYADENVLSDVARIFGQGTFDAVYADLVYFHSDNPDKILRRYNSARFSRRAIRWGLMPAHPTLFLRREVFERFGVYRSDYRIAADFEFIARIFASDTLRAHYEPRVWVRMQIGGASTAGLQSVIRLNREVRRACRENGIATSYAMLLSKYPQKLLEVFTR